MKVSELLNLKMIPNDCNAATIGEYLKNLLVNLWDEKEEFSGKKPFGNSDWEDELYYTLAKNILFSNREYDETYVMNKVTKNKADRVIFELIKNMFNPDYKINI